MLSGGRVLAQPVVTSHIDELDWSDRAQAPQSNPTPTTNPPPQPAIPGAQTQPHPNNSIPIPFTLNLHKNLAKKH